MYDVIIKRNENYLPSSLLLQYMGRSPNNQSILEDWEGTESSREGEQMFMYGSERVTDSEA